ncbi:hypothetical protein LTR15_007764 [Elasticomyces elasticus]|nr:hypothetical protein LTR15_007764 [Elasticomyces elasticus]
MKLTNSLACSAMVALAIVTPAAGQTEPRGELYCATSATSASKDVVALAIGEFCAMHNGHVMNKYESIWNTMSVQDGGHVKLNIFYAGTATYGIASEACDTEFEAVLTGCNKDGGTTEGGNYLAQIGTVYYMMTVNPPADQQTSGTYPA